MVKKQFFKSPNLVVHKNIHVTINTDFENDIVHLFDDARSEYFQLPMNPFFLTWGTCLNWRAMLFQFNSRGATRKECKTEFNLSMSMNVFLRYPPGLKFFCAE